MMRLFIGAVVLTGLLSTQAAHAHGAYPSVLKYSGEFVAVLEHDTRTERIEPRELTRFFVHVWNKDGTESVDFTHAKVSISRVDTGATVVYTPLFVGTIYRSASGIAEFEYMFDAGGTYRISVQYVSAEKEVAAADFEVVVEPVPPERTRFKTYGICVLGVIVVFAAGRYSRRKEHAA